MNALARFEGFMQELMDRRVVRLLGGSLQPVELAHAIARCLDGLPPAAVAPDRFQLLLHPSDAADLRALDQSLERKLGRYAVELARERSLNFHDSPVVLLVADPDQERGHVDVRSEVTGKRRPRPARGAKPAAPPSRRAAREDGSRWRSTSSELNGSEAASLAGRRVDDGQHKPDDRVRWQRPASSVHKVLAPSASQSRAGLFLEVPQTGGSATHLPVDHLPFFIGRLEGSDLVLADSSVSRRHAVIEGRDGCYFLRDLGSRNGSSVNGAAVTDAQLRNGDRVGIGGFEMVVRFSEGV